jgi:deoxyadenosine/deoxycytidine kinase
MTAKPRIYSIDGNIGSGKSTLLNKLKAHYGGGNENVVFADEPVSEWETIADASGKTMLEKFYQDQEKWSFSFQMMAYISRLHILRQKVKENPGLIIITERSLHTDRYVFAKMLYDSGLIEDVNYQIYLKWFDHFLDECSISGIIYVKTDPEICFQRIKERSRTGESDIALAYLKKCDEYHERMICEHIINKFDVLTLDGTQNIFSDAFVLNGWIQSIDFYISSTPKRV